MGPARLVPHGRVALTVIGVDPARGGRQVAEVRGGWVRPKKISKPRRNEHRPLWLNAVSPSATVMLPAPPPGPAPQLQASKDDSQSRLPGRTGAPSKEYGHLRQLLAISQRALSPVQSTVFRNRRTL